MDELERLDEIQSEQNKRKSLDIDAMIEGTFRKKHNFVTNESSVTQNRPDKWGLEMSKTMFSVS